jgi:hypothetical protein
MIPTAPAAGVSVTSGAANTFTTTAVQMTASTGAALYITALTVQLTSTSVPTYVEVQIGTGPATETTVDQEVLPIAFDSGLTGTKVMARVDIYPPIPVANATRIAVKTADSIGALAWLITLTCINQSNVVAATTESANVLQWNTTNVSSPATAGVPDINVIAINNGATNGNNATLKLAGLNITQPTGGGDAVVIAGGNGNAGSTVGGIAVKLTGGSTFSGNTNPSGDGLKITGGAGTSGNVSGVAIRATGGTGASGPSDGIDIVGGAAVSGAAAGHGVQITGGAATTNAASTGGDALKLVGANASGAGAAGVAMRATGGAASTTGAGAQGVTIVGGAGAASGNGASAGLSSTAGGTTTVSGSDGVIFTGTGNGNGMTAAKAGSGQDINSTLLAVTTATTATNLTNAATSGDFTAAMKTSLNAATPTVSLGTNAPAGWINAAAIASSALNGKGDWLLASSYTTPPTVAAIATGVWQDATAGDFTTTNSVGKSLYNSFTTNTSVFTVAALANAPTGGAAPTVAQIATGVWQDTTVGDFTTALSIGKSVLNGVTLGTGLTINAYTGNTPQTGDAYARIGAAGAGLTALGDTRIAHLDADTSSRMATYTQPTGFLAATFPSGTIANTTNITAGTITTATNLTNLPSIPANWITSTGITAAALNGKGDWLLASSYTAPPSAAAVATTVWQDLTSSSDFTTTGSIGKLFATDVDAAISSRSTYAGADTSGTTTLLGRLTSTRATNLDNLDASISSRMATFTLPSNFASLSIDASGRVDLGNWLGSAPNSLNNGWVQADVEGWTSAAPPSTSVTGVPVVDVHYWTGQGPPSTNVSGVPLVDVSRWNGTLPNNLISGRVDANAQVVGDKTGYSIASLPSIPANWITSAGISAGALNGKGDWLLASGYTAPNNVGITAIKAKTDNLPADPASNTEVDTRMATFALPTNFSILAIDGSGDVTFNNAVADPLSVTLPGPYTGHQTGALIWRIANKP